MSIEPREQGDVCCKLRVLVVEDWLAPREDHIKNLIRWSFEPVVAEGMGSTLLANAIEQAKKMRCHVALVDMRLLNNLDNNDTSGLELARQLKLIVPITIIVSAYGDRETVVKALRGIKVDDFVGKEEGPRRLRSAIEEALRFNCRCNLMIDWYANYQPADIMRKLRLQDPAMPNDEPECALRRLYANDEVDQLVVKPIATYYRPSESATLTEHSVVLVGRARSRQGLWRQWEIIKLASSNQIQSEYNNYRTYVAPYLSNQRTARIEDRANCIVFWDIGAIRYTNIAVEQRKPLRQWYASADASDLVRAMEDLFNETLGPWLNIPSQQQDITIYDNYVTSFPKLALGIDAYTNSDNQISIPGLQQPLRDPIVWARSYRRRSRFFSRRDVYIHGDLHSDNIFVDQHAATCVIDYERSGPGYMLRDFVELEVDIRLRLLPLVRDELALLFYLDMLLLAPEQPDTPPRWEEIPGASARMQGELHKAFTVICALRRLASQLTRFEQMEEYYWALLMETLISALRKESEWSDPDLSALARDRALLSASLISERLARWGTSWPPPEWTAFDRGKASAGARYADNYTVYEVAMQQLLSRMQRNHSRFSELLVYQQRLTDNIARARQFGGNENNLAERSAIILQLNELALTVLGVSFNELGEGK